MATAVTKQTQFAIPIGQTYTGAGVTAKTKTQYDTNLVQAGMLDAPKKFLVKAVAVVLRSDVEPSDLNSFIGTTTVELIISGKSYWLSLVSKCPGGAGSFWNGVSPTALTAGTAGSNGWPSAQNVATITDPMPQIPGLDPMEPILGQLIEQNQNFNVTLDPTISGSTAFTTKAAAPTTIFVGTGINAHTYLEGVLARAIL